MIATPSLPSLESRSLDSLDHACRRETKRYQRSEASDTRFCLEIFQRALRLMAETPDSASAASERAIGEPERRRHAYTDEAARNLLVTIYSEFIKAQINRSAAPGIPLDDLVQQIWQHFWQAANGGLTFVSLEAALAYLKRTTISTLIRRRRQTWRAAREESLQQFVDVAGDGVLADEGADLFAEHTKQRFPDRCREILTDPLEQRLFWMRYSMGWPPRRIADQLKQAGVLLNERPATARSVSDLLDRCIKRLCLDQEIRDLLQND
jgi:hypothetical protein